MIYCTNEYPSLLSWTEAAVQLAVQKIVHKGIRKDAQTTMTYCISSKDIKNIHYKLSRTKKEIIISRTFQLTLYITCEIYWSRLMSHGTDKSDTLTLRSSHCSRLLVVTVMFSQIILKMFQHWRKSNRYVSTLILRVTFVIVANSITSVFIGTQYLSQCGRMSQKFR